MTIGDTTEDNDTLELPDWTVDPDTGRTNSSPEFLRLVDKVARLIVSSGQTLLSQGAEPVARLIMAQLAHNEQMRPAADSIK